MKTIKEVALEMIANDEGMAGADLILAVENYEKSNPIKHKGGRYSLKSIRGNYFPRVFKTKKKAVEMMNIHKKLYIKKIYTGWF